MGIDAYVPAYLGRILSPTDEPAGTCFQVAQGILVTAYHVLDAIDAIAYGATMSVEPLAGGSRATATVLRTDRDSDLAVLRTSGPLARCLADVALSDAEPKDGDVWVTGSATADDATRYRFINAPGNWTGGAQPEDGLLRRKVWCADLMPGMSGAPVVRDDSVLVGVVTARNHSADGYLANTGWVTRTEDLLPLLAGLADLTVERARPGDVAEKVWRDLRFAVQARTANRVALLTDQNPLAVSWTPVRLARTPNVTGDGDPASGLAALFHDSGRSLLIIGSAGSGKTTMATLVMKRILDASGPDAPLPVLLSLNSWDPRYEPLLQWMARTLAEDYRGLPGVHPRALRDGLVAGRIVPVLDGFDEIKEERRKDAAKELDLALRVTRAIVTYRMDPDTEFSHYVLPTSDAVRMDPVSAVAAAAYLTGGWTYPPNDPWCQVAAAFTAGTHPELTATFASPLMTWLARTVYAPRSADDEDATVLLDTERYPSRPAVEDHLMAKLVPSVFARARADGVGDRRRLSDPDDAEHWLGFLATQVEDGSRFGFWSLERMIPARRMAVVAAALAGVVIALVFGRSADLAVGLQLSLMLGVVFGCGFSTAYSVGRARGKHATSRFGFGIRESEFRPTMNTPKLIWGLVAALVALLAAGLLTVLLRQSERTVSSDVGYLRAHWVALVAWSAAALVVAGVIGMVGGAITAWILRNAKGFDSHTGASAPTPAAAARQDVSAFLIISVLAWTVGGIVTGFALWRATGSGFWTGLLTGAVSIIGASLMFNAWTRYRVALVWLVGRGRLPWSAMRFLDEAFTNQVLRQNGTTYEFRHTRLRESLAAAYHSRDRRTTGLAAAR